MTRGPSPTPTKQNKIRGYPGKRKRNEDEPVPGTAVKKPWGMGREQKKFWDEHAVELERMRVLTGVDVPAFRLMVEHYVIALGAAKQLQADGYTVEGKDGLKKHPLAQVFKDNSMAFKSYSDLFGMNPSARTRMKTPPPAEQLSLYDQLFQAVGEVVVGEDEVVVGEVGG